jgi:hypothetical protein
MQLAGVLEPIPVTGYVRYGQLNCENSALEL